MIALFKTSERANNLSYVNNYVFQRHIFAYSTALKNQLPGKQVLELGCGEGYGLQMLLPHTDLYLAVDKKWPSQVSFKEHLLFQSRRLPELAGISENMFDTVICFQVIEHIKNDNRLLQEIKRVLKPGGNLLLTTPNIQTSLTRNPFHIREYLPQQITSLISTHFTSYSIQGIYGSDMVMAYYNENRKNVAGITRYDIFNLQYRLPAFLLKGIYSLLNNYNRLLIARKVPDITVNISETDFFLDNNTENCLDYFVIARKDG